jgi:glycosyltransferase involved in cell wall biosynthesis
LKYGLIRSDQYTLIKGSGADTTRLIPTQKPAGNPLIVLPGRMLFSKGVGEFVRAAQILCDNGIKARFALVGDTDLANPDAVPVKQLEAWVAEGVVEWWGWQDDIASIYSQAHIVCLPSYREGLPKALIEAAASGCPIVATDAPGCRDVVRHGENGLLVPIRDAGALADALEILIKDPNLCKKMGLRGREIVEAEYSETLIISETMKIFNQLIIK